MAEQTGEKTTDYQKAVRSIQTVSQLGSLIKEFAQQPEGDLPPIILALARFSYLQAQSHRKESQSELSTEAKEASSSFIKMTVTQALWFIDSDKTELVPLFLQQVAKYHIILVAAHTVLRRSSSFNSLSEGEQNSLLRQLNKEISQGGTERLKINLEETLNSPKHFSYDIFKAQAVARTEGDMQGVLAELLAVCYLRHAGCKVHLAGEKEDVIHGTDLIIIQEKQGERGGRNTINIQVESHTSLPPGKIFEAEFIPKNPVPLHLGFSIPRDFLQKSQLERFLPIFSKQPSEDPRIEKFRNMLESALNEKRQYEQRKSSRQSK